MYNFSKRYIYMENWLERNIHKHHRCPPLSRKVIRSFYFLLFCWYVFPNILKCKCITFIKWIKVTIKWFKDILIDWWGWHHQDGNIGCSWHCLLVKQRWMGWRREGGIRGMDMCMHSCCCWQKTNTTLQNNYPPIKYLIKNTYLRIRHHQRILEHGRGEAEAHSMYHRDQ